MSAGVGVKTIKAITLIQPWATLMAIDAKRIETRSWGTNYRGSIAIHAGKKADEYLADEEPFRPVLAAAGYHTDVAYDLPAGAIVAVGRLVECRPMPKVSDASMECWVRDLSECPHEFDFGCYEPGRYAWVFADIVKLPAPIEARGAQGLWDWAAPHAV